SAVLDGEGSIGGAIGLSGVGNCDFIPAGRDPERPRGGIAAGPAGRVLGDVVQVTLAGPEGPSRSTRRVTGGAAVIHDLHGRQSLDCTGDREIERGGSGVVRRKGKGAGGRAERGSVKAYREGG